jgi:ribonucleoside-diphosphate reductase alpha chain
MSTSIRPQAPASVTPVSAHRDGVFVPPAGIASDLSPIARTILGKRYLIKDATGAVTETPESMFWRVATTMAMSEARYGLSELEQQRLAEAFYALMIQRRWEPNSPTLMNAGRPLGQLSACFVLPVADALANGTDGIYDTLTSMALIHQSGGGTGFSFSRVRARGAMVKSTTGVASGPVSFMELYDASTEAVKQGGTRRGANMGVLRCDHPDVLEFINCKADTTRITNFNISIAATDVFMSAVEQGTSYDLCDPNSAAVVGSLDARTVFEQIVQHAWSTGEPGILFIDEANRHNPVPHLGAYEATNPCGEQWLLPFDVCNLGSLNLAAYVLPATSSVATAWQSRIDWDRMRTDIHLSTRFLDNVIDANTYPLPQVADLARRIRRIGNGVMGYADALIALDLPFNSAEGVAAGRALAEFFYTACQEASESLAVARGTFPEWEQSIWGPDATCARDATGDRIRPMRALRNCNVNTVAPTGTISIIAGCSSGIEPLFAVAFMRNQAGAMMADVNPMFVERARAEGWYSADLMERIATAGHIHFPEVPAAVQRVFVTAHDIAPAWHIDHQAAWQGFTDSSISKTTNFPASATPADVRDIYLRAHKAGCKGVTVYRDGSRSNQVLSTGATGTMPSVDAALATQLQEAEAQVAALTLALAEARSVQRRVKQDRPDEMSGTTRRIQSPLGDLYVTLNVNGAGQPFEIFATLGKAGGAAMADVEAIARLASLALRSGIPIDAVHAQLRGISSDKAVGFGPGKVLSVPDAIAQVIEKSMTARAGVQQTLALALTPGEAVLTVAPELARVAFAAPVNTDAGLLICDNCQSAGSIEMAEGCLKCHSCGHSKCS